MLGSGSDYYGVAPVEETIAWADVIARVELLSVTAVAEQQTGETDYVAALDYRFRVLEYLRGSGSSELVAVAWDGLDTFSTSGSAVTRAEALKGRRDTQWDSREAILFLENSHPELPSTSQANRYRLGGLYFDEPWEDYYTIASRWDKRWLPAASSEAGGASGSSDTQSFLLDSPAATDGASGVSGQSETTPTITLSALKAKIAANDREIAAGGGSEAYKDCLYRKTEQAREAQYELARIVEIGGQGYYYKRFDATLGSGLAGGTMAFTDSAYSGFPATPPPDADDVQLTGRDAALFRTRWPVVLDTMRPLPAGEYKTYFTPRPKIYIICDGMPDLEKKREELFLTVTAPTGTLHEAFFDPVTIGTAIGANATNGVLKPNTFTGADGAAATISGMTWESGTVTLGVTPDDALAGQVVDVIGLDGTASLSLSVANATVDSAKDTLSWSVSSQPWENGDTLMLRIHDGTAPAPTPVPPTATPIPPTATPVPPAAPTFAVTASGAVTWSYDFSDDQVFKYYEVRWVEDTGQAPSNWTGKQNVVFYSKSASSHQITGLTAGTTYRVKLFIGVKVSDAWKYIKADTVTITAGG